METRQIRYFVAVAEELHFGRAATRLGIAQPALSAQIKGLERALKARLLIRSTRSVVLTPAGEALYGRCLRILAEIGEAAALVGALSGDGARRIAVGSIHPATLGVLPRFLARLSRRFGERPVELLNADSETLVRRIERGALDFAFVRPIPQTHGLDYEEIGREPYLLALPAGSPLAREKQLRLDHLAGERIVARSKQGIGLTERYFDALFARSGLAPRIGFRCNDTVSILALVSAGLGVGFVPAWVRGFADESVALRSVAEVDYRVGLGVAWRRDAPGFHPEDLVDLARQAFAASSAMHEAAAIDRSGR